jgi:hypothetical protein
MHKIYFLCSCLIFLTLLSCNTGSSSVADNTDEKEIQTENSSADNEIHNSTTAIRKNTMLDGGVVPLIQKHPFFKDVKNAKSGTENGMKIEVKSSCEYIEQDGKEVLDGKSTVSTVAMGFGGSISANFKDGKLQGVAYETMSTPNTYMLRMEFDKDLLQEASIFILEMETCLGYGPIKGKSLTELKSEFSSLLTNSEIDKNKFKPVDCPTEMNELFQ